MNLPIDNTKEFTNNVIDALCMLRSAKFRIRREIIANCFRHSGFIIQSQSQDELENGVLAEGSGDETNEYKLPSGITFEDLLLNGR